ncbi:L-rhamnose mutarotase [Aestuariibaculum suncheonense]|uniref:L-rhamnose mutarotase n=1 Tax=Aestuariibaculum suncheonense TaxID=1028745 RepID=A0A8J6QGJ8_9FLAO|nr:L-rhamnose mutarotase [Aestuariibaculum suncheonense]MBD0836208.1 L-rhamnose mutarotase [Aestuariibaculum suncheonense]
MKHSNAKKYCYIGLNPILDSFKSLNNNIKGYRENDLTFVITTTSYESLNEDKKQMESYFKEIHGPLERIFKKPETAINKNTPTASKQLVLTLNLQPDPELRKEYIDIHKPDAIWPEIINNMNTMGVLNMELYLQEYRVFMIMEVKDTFDIYADSERWGKLPREKEWQDYVSKFQRIDKNNDTFEKWQIMKPMF